MRASAAASAPRDPARALARSASPSVRSPSPHAGGKRPARTRRDRQRTGMQRPGAATPRDSPPTVPSTPPGTRHEPRPFSRSQSGRARRPLGHPWQGRRHLLGTVEEQQQRPPRVPCHPGQPLRPDVAQLTVVRLGGSTSEAAAPAECGPPRGPHDPARPLQRRAGRVATERSVSRGRRRAAHKVGAGVRPGHDVRRGPPVPS